MSHFLIMYRPPRPTFPQDITEAETKIVEEHGQYLKRLFDEKKVIVFGRIEDARFGICILDVADEHEAREIMDNDPAVVKYLFTADVMPFRLALLQDPNK
jgi:uncharacterized protein YciI